MIALSGCETFTPPSRKITLKQDSTYVLDTNSNRRATYLKRGPDDKWYLVAEPPPDTAIASTVKAAAELAIKTSAGSDASGKGSVEVAQSLTKLVERTQAVTILRDSLYRLSEAYANNVIQPTEYATLFGDVLMRVQAIVVADQLRADADKQQAMAEIAKSEAEWRLKALNILSDPQADTEDKNAARLMLSPQPPQ